VAFATSDRHQVDEHFGAASAMLIYAVTSDQATVVEFAQFGELDQDGHESKLAAKLALLQGCAVVYCQAGRRLGDSAIAGAGRPADPGRSAYRHRVPDY
jgi:nitrogen fixation protein NifX